MCGRFVLFTESLLDEVGNLPGVQEVHAPQGTPGPRYNIAPTQPIPIVRVREELAEVDPARWALLPQWKKDMEGPPLLMPEQKRWQANHLFAPPLNPSAALSP